MAGFTDHITEAKKNLKVLKVLNSAKEIDYHWQITLSYYSALHFINAFLSDVSNVHPGNHQLLKDYIEPNSRSTMTRLSCDLYSAYNHLEIISRKARYLCDNNGKSCERGFFPNEKDFHRAIKYLDQTIDYIVAKYSISIDTIELVTNESKYTKNLKYISIILPDLIDVEVKQTV